MHASQTKKPHVPKRALAALTPTLRSCNPMIIIRKSLQVPDANRNNNHLERIFMCCRWDFKAPQVCACFTKAAEDDDDDE